jgi:hypothetical protein
MIYQTLANVFLICSNVRQVLAFLDPISVPWSAPSMTSYLARCKNAAQNFWRGWNEQDLVRLGQRLDDPAAYSGGILKLTAREYRALPEFNRRVMANKPRAVFHPVLAWVEGRGLRLLRRAG